MTSRNFQWARVAVSKNATGNKQGRPDMLLAPHEDQGLGADDPLGAFWPMLVDLAAGRGRAPAHAADLCPLWDLYAAIAQGAAAPAFVVGQLGQSLDGRVATATGKSRYINGPEAIRHLHRLRALVDAVV